jgi:hypothetical protein
MHVISSRLPGRHRARHRPLAALPVLALAMLAGVAQAAGFDDKLRAPVMKSTAEFKTQSQGYTKKYLEAREKSPVQQITSASLARQRFDLIWQIEHSIDTRKPLDELAEIGIASRGDGSYFVDLDEHPEWLEQSRSLIGMVHPDFLENTVVGLEQGGFRPVDVARFRKYVATHDPNVYPSAPLLELALGFARAVRKFDSQKIPVPDSLVFSYWYQRNWLHFEADRAWAEGLLKGFDAQRQRILMTVVMYSRNTLIWAPDDIATGIPDLLATVRQPDYEQRVTAEAKGVAP